MPWYAPWSDQIAKRVCKYLLQRYLGQFLLEKLSLDQLNVDLYKGIGTITDVALDVLALNELAEQQRLPFEFTDGFVSEMSVSIPWSSLLSESCEIQVHGLEMAVKYKERDKSKVSMFESMWSSMSSSMQLAEDCIRTETENESDGEAANQPIEGIERFAQTIDSVLTRIRVKFHETTIRLEETAGSSTTGVVLEAVIKYMEYHDEAGEVTPNDISAPGFEIPAFATKKFYLEGVTFYSEEFLLDSSESTDVDNDLEPTELIQDLCSKGRQFDGRPAPSSDAPVDSIPIARLAGRQEVVLQFKQEGVSGPKVTLQVVLGALTLFASPRQIHKMMRIIKAISPAEKSRPRGSKPRCPQKPMEESDFRKIEQELLTGLNQGSEQLAQFDSHGWCDTSMDDSQDFSPIKSALLYNESVMSPSSSLASSTSSLGSSRSCTSSQPSYMDIRRSHAGTVIDTDPAVFHFRIVLSSVALVLLHDDILNVNVSSPLATAASLSEMKHIAEDFFTKLGHFVVSGFGNKDFEDAKKIFLNACHRNHIRFLAAPVIVEGNETSTNHGSVLKGSMTAASMELLECLIENGTQIGEGDSEHVQLLAFSRNRNDNDTIKFEAQPSLRVNFKFSESVARRDRGRKVSQPRSEFSFTLQPLEIELDLSIIDRISPLLHPEPPTETIAPKEKRDTPVISHAQQSLDNSTTVSARKDLKIFSSLVIFKIRFPIPDLRPLHDMERAPWWRRHVRSDVILLELTDLTMMTIMDPLNPVKKYELQCCDLLAKFQDADMDTPTPFIRISADSASNTNHDKGQSSEWPRIILSFHPEIRPGELQTPILDPSLAFTQSMGHSLIATLERTKQRELSPFSFQTVIHGGDDKCDGEELVTPANKTDMAEFIDVASTDTRLKIDITCPTMSVLLSSKHFYEVIYNRLTTDLLLWKPSAPVREVSTASTNISYIDDSTHDATFSLCKSGIQLDSDSDEESMDGQFFPASSQYQDRRKRRLPLETNASRAQSRIALSFNVGHGSLDLCLPVRDSQGNIIPGQVGEVLLTVEKGMVFYTSGFKNKADLDYLCVQANQCAMYHNGLVGDACLMPSLRTVASPIPHYLHPTISKMDVTASSEESSNVGTGSCQSLDMLTLAVKISRDERCRSLKYFRVAMGLRNSALRYLVCESRSSWFNQVIDFFDVDDYPIAGYDPSTVLIELNLHLWNCNVDYRPLYLPLRSILNLRSFNISSNIASKTNSSTLRFIAEDAAFFISNKMGHRPCTGPVNLRKDYVCVVEMGLFELSLRLCEQSFSSPKVDLRASANGLLIRTCADSAKALAELLSYFASDGDLHGYEMDAESFCSAPTNSGLEEEQVLVSTEEEPSQLLSKSQVARVNDLMHEAMLESRVAAKGTTRAFFTVDEDDLPEMIQEQSEPKTESPILGSDVIQDDKDDSWENEFCILDNEAGLGILPKSGLPEVRLLTDEPLRIVDNHFSIPTGRTDHLRSPKHFPHPVLRYTLREATLVWQLYGGSDFDPPPPPKHVNIGENASSTISTAGAITFSKSSPTSVRFEAPPPSLPTKNVDWRERGGTARRNDILMELQLDKVQFQHEVYPEHTTELSRQVLLVKEVEIRDRLATSQINKFLYQYCSEAKPKQSHAHMIVIKAVHMRADPKVNVQECCLKISLLPLRFNIDQDSILFLFQFFSDVSGENKEEGDEEQSVTSRNQTPTHTVTALPVMSVTTEGEPAEPIPPPAPLLIQLEEPRPAPRVKRKPRRETTPTSPPAPPLYFRCVMFSPEVPVKLDYQGKHVDLSHGPLAGLLLGLGQLNNSEFKLKRITHRHGLLGVEKLMQFLLNEWSSDLKRNQLPGLLGGVGPMHSLVQLFQGVRDLFWLPIEQYQKDGRLVRGFQRGANSFTTSSAMAVLELTSRLIQIIQSTAETAYDMVSPGPSVRMRRAGKGKRKQYPQPVDIREGVANAILVVRDGIGETALNIIRVASEEHEQKGMTGAVGGVLRQIPPTVVKPIILATEATNNVIGGMRSQLVPDARKEAVEKWRGQSS